MNASSANTQAGPAHFHAEDDGMRAPVELVPGIELHRAWLDEPDAWFAKLRAELKPRQEYLHFGRGPVPMPRLTAWYGHPGAIYRYSRLVNVPAPWTPHLGELRVILNERFGTALNSCLVNVYADGTRSMGWHADDEPELRDRIVSVSLGATRTFRLRNGGRGATIPIELDHGSVLTMTVDSQRTWQHAVPKESVAGLRLNLTFRAVAEA